MDFSWRRPDQLGQGDDAPRHFWTRWRTQAMTQAMTQAGTQARGIASPLGGEQGGEQGDERHRNRLFGDVRQAVSVGYLSRLSQQTISADYLSRLSQAQLFQAIAQGPDADPQ